MILFFLFATSSCTLIADINYPAMLDGFDRIMITEIPGANCTRNPCCILTGSSQKSLTMDIAYTVSSIPQQTVHIYKYNLNIKANYFHGTLVHAIVNGCPSSSNLSMYIQLLLYNYASQNVQVSLKIWECPMPPPSTVHINSNHVNFTYLAERSYRVANFSAIGSNYFDISTVMRDAIARGHLNATDILHTIILKSDTFSAISNLSISFKFHQFTPNYTEGDRQWDGKTLILDFQNQASRFQPDVMCYLRNANSTTQENSNLSLVYKAYIWYYLQVDRLRFVKYVLGYKNTTKISSIAPAAVLPRVDLITQLNFDWAYKEGNVLFNPDVYNFSRSICITISFREDWDGIRLTHTSRLDPHSQMYICKGNNPWIGAQPIGEVSIGPAAYNLEKYRQCMDSVCWDKIIYIYSSTSNLDGTISSPASIDQTIVSFDLMPFLSHVQTQIQLKPTAVVSCIEAGLWVRTGYGYFYPGKVVLTPELAPQPQSMLLIETFVKGISSIIRSAMATPNLCLLTGVLTLLRFINDVSYLQYHQKLYDAEIQDFSRTAYEIENGKWMPAYLTQQLKKVNYTYGSKIQKEEWRRIPTSYVQLGQSYSFLDATQNVWLWSMPFSIITFLLLYFIRSKVRHRKVRSWLVKCSSFSFLAISLLSENIQFFSFRGFTQFYGLEIIRKESIVDYANTVFSLVMLFLVLLYAVASPWLFFWFCKKKVLRAIYDDSKLTLRLCVCTSLFYLLRFANGFIHSFLYSTPIVQIGLLNVSQLVFLFLLYSQRKISRLKTILALRIFEACLHFVLVLVLLLEMTLRITDQYTPLLFDHLGYLNATCILSIMVVGILIIFFSFVVSQRNHVQAQKHKVLQRIKPEKGDSNNLKSNNMQILKVQVDFSESNQKDKKPSEKKQRNGWSAANKSIFSRMLFSPMIHNQRL